MNRNELRIKLQLLLNECQFDLTPTEIDLLATVITTLIYSEKEVRSIWYGDMKNTSQKIADYYNTQAKLVLNALDISDEEKAKLVTEVEKSISHKNKKVQN